MPELPEVETVARGLSQVLTGKTILKALVRRPDLRKPFPKNLGTRLAGQTIRKITRRAKFVLVHLGDGSVLLIHLGMSGRILLGSGAPPEGKHKHFVLVCAGGSYACLEDPRRFGLVDLIAPDKLNEHPMLAGLGPEPFDPTLDAKKFHALLSERKGPIKPTLMDQGLIAGIGNIYASEALFRAQISPLRPSKGLALRESRALLKALRGVLTEAIESGGSTLRDHVRPDGGLGYFQHHFAVYDRDGEACPRCKTKSRVQRIVQAGRATFYCQRCQA
jgi:formamidopyrimidine-DNA glycosylase